MQDDLGITPGVESRPPGCEIGSDALIVVEFAVLGQHQVPVRGDEWLPATFLVQVDDGQAGMAESDTFHGLPAKAIGTAVILDSRHRDQGFRIDGAVSVRVYESGYSTHRIAAICQVKVFIMEESRAMRMNTAPRAWAKYQLWGVSSSSRGSSSPRASGWRTMASGLSGDDSSRR